MKSTDTNPRSLRENYLRQIYHAYETACLADQREQKELCEMSVHYLFDLLDWGRRNIKISDEEPVFADVQTEGVSNSPKNILELEAFAESKICNQ